MHVTRRDFGLLAASTAGLAAIGPAYGVGEPSLQALAARTGRFFGAAAVSTEIRIAEYRALLAAQCGFLIPAWEMKWGAIERDRSRPTFARSDAIVQLAEAAKLKMRGHALIWHVNMPDWAKAELEASKSFDIVEQHVRRLIARYPRLAHWDVVNEAIEPQDGGDGMRRSPFFRALGETYLDRSFELARQLSPASALYLNEYGVDYDGRIERDRRSALLRLIERLRRRNVPLDGIGIQAHLRLQAPMFSEAAYRRFLTDLAGFGLDIVISELDVLEQDFALPTPERDLRVATEVKRYLDVALDERRVRGICTWGLSDRWSWRNADRRVKAAGTRNRGLPYDEDFVAKPMRSAVAAALTGAPGRR